MKVADMKTTLQDGFRPLLPRQLRVIMKPGMLVPYGKPGENICIGCGCTDSHGCLTMGGACSWLRVDTQRGLGVCSECEHMVGPYDEARGINANPA